MTMMLRVSPDDAGPDAVCVSCGGKEDRVGQLMTGLSSFRFVCKQVTLADGHHVAMCASCITRAREDAHLSRGYEE